MKTHISCSVTFFIYIENHDVYEIMWKNTAQSDRPQMTIWRMLIASWITKPTDSDFGGAEVGCWPLIPKIAGSNSLDF